MLLAGTPIVWRPGSFGPSRPPYRTVPGVHRVARLRRKIGADLRPFTPLPKRPRHHVHFHRVVARILFEERALLGHLQTVTHDLERRIRVRKAKGKCAPLPRITVARLPR